MGRLPGLGAVKVTRADHLDVLVTDEAILNEPGKDTALLRAGGARRVAWLRCPPARMASRLAEAVALMGDLDGVLIEGNSPMAHWHASLRVFVFGKDLHRLKPSARFPLAQAQWVVVNRSRPLEPHELATVRAHNPTAEVFVFDAAKPGAEGEAFLEAVEAAWRRHAAPRHRSACPADPR